MLLALPACSQPRGAPASISRWLFSWHRPLLRAPTAEALLKLAPASQPFAVCQFAGGGPTKHATVDAQ